MPFHPSSESQPPPQDALSLRALPRLVFIPRAIKHGWACATWQASPAYGFLLLGTWWLACLSFNHVATFVIPILPIIFSCFHWAYPYKEVKDKSERLRLAQETLAAIDYFENWLSRLTWADPLTSRRSLLALVYLYLVWVSLQFVLGTRVAALLIGTVCLVWRHPWVVAIRRRLPIDTTLQTIVTLALGSPLSPTLDDAYALSHSLTQRVEDFQRQMMHSIQEHDLPAAHRSFEFVIYENQRFWPGAGWKNTSLPIERAPWTDASNKPVKSKSLFGLPETIQTSVTDPDLPSHLRTRTWRWTWTDPDWKVDLKQHVDELGWSYGTALWTTLGAAEHHNAFATRRRRWTRMARLEYFAGNDGARSPTATIDLDLSHSTPNPPKKSSDASHSQPSRQVNPPTDSVWPAVVEPHNSLSAVTSIPRSSTVSITSTEDVAPIHEGLSRAKSAVSQRSFSTSRFSLLSDSGSVSGKKRFWSTQRQASVPEAARDSGWKSISRVKK